MLPLDHPHPGRPHRVYFALTNRCNRACPWCSTFSSRTGGSFITLPQLLAALPAQGPFEAQLEGGEPTLHPQLFALAAALRATGRCRLLVLCTNGVALPRRAGRLRAYLARLGEPLLVKLSFNHHLLEQDPGLPALAALLRQTLMELGGERRVLFNLRLRRGVAGDDRAVVAAAEAAGLLPEANRFFLQRYGRAAGEQGWDPPWLAGEGFHLVNPDGRCFGTDLIGRAEAMGQLP